MAGDLGHAGLSSEGGVDIESVAEETPEAIAREHIDPAFGLHPFQARKVVYEAGIPREVAGDVASILTTLYDLYESRDASEIEINPVMITGEGDVVAAARTKVLDRAAAIEALQTDEEALGFTLSEAQAEHIVRMQLGSLTSMEAADVETEYEEVQAVGESFAVELDLRARTSRQNIWEYDVIELDGLQSSVSGTVTLGALDRSVSTALGRRYGILGWATVFKLLIRRKYIRRRIIFSAHL